MDNNDLNRRIRYALQLDDSDTMRCASLGGIKASLEEVSGWRLKESDSGWVPCTDEALLALLAGLIVDRRGVQNTIVPIPDKEPAGDKTADGNESREVNRELDTLSVAATRVSVDNNIVLKQLRIALSLRTDDVHGLILAGGGRLGKTEVTALFRKPAARNYRRCGDQVMRWFLAGLATRRTA